MSANQHTYTIAANAIPFSVIRGGFANFSTTTCIKGEPIKQQTTTQITWILRDRFTNEVFSARQDVSNDHAALYSELVCEKPLVDNHVYETISVSTPNPPQPTVMGATAAQAKAENRLGVARGTHIMTNRGEVRVEKLQVGDRVITRDRGMQEIRWIGSEKVDVTPENAPILFSKGTIKNARDLIVSADHRVVLKGAEAMTQYGVKEVLVPARMLVDNITIQQAVGGMMEFFQILTDQHEVIYAEAAAAESFMPSPQALSLLKEESRQEILTVFPVLAAKPDAYGPCVRGFVEA